MFNKNKLLFQWLIILSMVTSLVACTVEPDMVKETVFPDASTAVETIYAPPTETPDVDMIVRTPTPAPTATPEFITKLVEQVVDTVGLDQVRILSLSVDDWINLFISLVIIFLSLIVIFRVTYYLLKRLVKLTPTQYDDIYLGSMRSYLRAFILLIGVQYATGRLLFLNPFLKQILNQFYYAIYVFLMAVAVWKLIDLFEVWYREKALIHGDEERTDASLMLTQRVLRGGMVMIGAILVLDRFGINVNALLAALGIGGLALSLAAQDSLSNMISGIILLTDRPFMVGHRIEIQGLNTWGDVISIGTRSTRIRTRDNRMVIVPNSILSGNQIVNYSYPDPQYRVQMDIGIGYGQDVEKVRHLLTETVRSIPGVLLDKPVDALYIEMGDSAMIFRVRWWIVSFTDTHRMSDHVNTALQKALDSAGIKTPYNTYDVNLKIGPEELDHLARPRSLNDEPS